jgi:hypothetical protein
MMFFFSCGIKDISSIAGKWRYDDPDKAQKYYILQINEDNTFILSEFISQLEVNSISGKIVLENSQVKLKQGDEESEDDNFTQLLEISMYKDVLTIAGHDYSKVTEASSEEPAETAAE